jgi:hypothetical protein
MHLTRVSRDTITVWIATIAFSSAFLNDALYTNSHVSEGVIESLGKDQEISAGPERRNV